MILIIALALLCLGCGGSDDDDDDDFSDPGFSDDSDDDDSAGDDDDDTPDSGEFQVGFSRVDVSPEWSVKMGGYGTYFLSENMCRWSTGIHDPIYATAIAFENPGQQPVILIHFDVVGLILPDIQLIGQGIADALKIDANRTVVAASHSHGSPDTIGIWGVMLPPISGRDEDYMTFLIQKGIEAGVQAYQARVPATLRVTTGIEDQMHENTQDVIDKNAVTDDTMTLLAAYDKDSKLIGTLMSWGCHPMVIGRDNTEITSDFLGPYYKFMDEELGGINMFVNTSLGAAVHPTNPYDPYDERTGGNWEDLDNFGRVLADDAQSLLEDTTPLIGTEIHLDTRTVYGELKNPFFALMGVLNIIPREIPALGEVGESTMTAFSVGGLRFGTAPGELVPNIGLDLRGVMGGQHQFLITLGMDWMGYIMTPEQYRNLLYIYFSILAVGPEMGNLLSDTYLDVWQEWPIPAI